MGLHSTDEPRLHTLSDLYPSVCPLSTQPPDIVNPPVDVLIALPKIRVLSFMPQTHSISIDAIPDLPAGNLLEDLWLPNCNVRSSLPSFANSPNLREIRLSGQHLTGGSQHAFDNCPNLQVRA